MYKYLVRETDYHGAGTILLIDSATGEILDFINYAYDTMGHTELALEILKMAKEFSVESIHFVTEDEVDQYLALAPIPEYGDEDEEEEEE